jgi:hypothetical protein
MYSVTEIDRSFLCPVEEEAEMGFVMAVLVILVCVAVATGCRRDP